MDFAQRAARNEEIFRSVNEKIDQGAAQHGIKAALPFHCECGRSPCLETVEVAPGDYERIAAERYRFVLVPGHEDQAIERVIERHPGFSVVEKIGEARKQLDHDHPQEHHQ